jgi:GTP cyclohydrolase II
MSPLTTHTPSTVQSLHAVCRVATRIPYKDGTITLLLYTTPLDNKEHLAIVVGSRIASKSLNAMQPGETDMDRIIRGATQTTTAADWSRPPLVRVHSECFTGEVLGSQRCDCGEQLNEAIRHMQQEGDGVLIYLRQEGRGIGLLDKLRAYNLQDQGHDTVTANVMLNRPADGRSYGIATDILQDLGIPSIRLLTNNPAKLSHLEQDGIVVVDRVAMVPSIWQQGADKDTELSNYLKTKVKRMGHMLDVPQ